MDERNAAAALPRRLRELRVRRNLTQQHVASALGVGVSSVSAWESTTALKPPPPGRLDEYARFFAGPPGEARLLGPDELSAGQRAERDRLVAELERLRLAAVGEPATASPAARRSLWHFPDGGPVQIICGMSGERPATASGRSHNYMQLSGYADVDSLVQLYGQLKAENPHSDIGYQLAHRMGPKDLRSHLVLLGSSATNPALLQTSALLTDVPVRQVPHEGLPDGEVFRLDGDPERLFLPSFVGGDPANEVIEDVGWFLRTPNPHNVDRTLTICGGVYTRGVFGSVRFLTDRDLRQVNEQVLSDMFGAATTFGVLMRVPAHDHLTATPDLRHPDTIRFSWSA
ncbi:MAG TPA: helix-turn-helix transcriptional regulator [Pseudonocardiaceae bacterium]